MANYAATLSLNVPAITALCKGNRGSIIYSASGLPTNATGLSADYYVDTSTGLYYGPKTNIWPTTPLFTLNLPVSSYPLQLVPSTTTLTIPTYGSNVVQGSYSGILGGIGNSLSGNNSFIIGSNNSLTGNNAFILGSNIVAVLPGFALVNNLSATGAIFASAGNSDQWHSAYTNLTANSANWQSTYTVVSSNSANWQSTYTVVSSNSANWQSAYNTTSTLAYISYTLNTALSSIIPSQGTFTITGTGSNINGGNFNNAQGSYASVLGGRCNTASGNYSNITGGFSGRTSGRYSNIAGGVCNTASGYGASIGGGTGNTASGFNSTIGAGAYNTASNSSAFIGGGRDNTASGLRSAIVGGYCNTASGDYSFVAGGSANETKGFANTFILGTSLSASQANYTYVNNISVQGNNYTGGNTVVNGTLGVTGTSTFNLLSTTGISTLNSLNVTNSATVIGSISSRSTIFGASLNIGNPNNSVTGNNSAVLGGQNNKASGNCTTVSGQYNCATSGSSTVLGGTYNCAITNTGAAIVGGYLNTNSGTYSTIAGGRSNLLKAYCSFIGAGLRNSVDGVSNAIVGGECNNIIIGSSCSFIAGGLCNNIPTGVNNAFILGSSLSASQSNFTYVNNLSSQVNAYIGNNIYTGGRTVSDPTIDMSGGLQVNGTGSTQLTISKNLSSSFAINVSEASPGTVSMYDYGRGFWNNTLFLSGGNVGIGTSSPGSKLTVSGGLSANGNITVGGNIVGGSTVINPQTSSYQLASTDNGAIITVNNASATNVTIPTGLPIGFTVGVMQLGAGRVTIVAGNGVTLNTAAAGKTTRTAYSTASILSISTNTYVVFGDITA